VTAVEVLSSRVLLAPVDFEASREWYANVLGLRVYREFGQDGKISGVVFFLGGGFLELSQSATPPGRGPTAPTLWLQVPDVDVEHARLRGTRRVEVTTPPATMPWGLRECWIEDPDGTRIVLVEVPEGHPIRTRLDVRDVSGTGPSGPVR
jgi:catechol 2,3-dioxygenase-like lactoylglutathione lyase family enzyme